MNWKLKAAFSYVAIVAAFQVAAWFLATSAGHSFGSEDYGVWSTAIFGISALFAIPAVIGMFMPNGAQP